MSRQQSLKNLNILVTRPNPQGKLLCELIQSYGGHAIYFPTLAIISTPSELLKKQLSQIEQFDVLIFISPQAVYHSKDIIPTVPKNLQWVAVGKSTAHALKEANFPMPIYPPHEWNSEGLLALPELQSVQKRKIAIIKGQGGRETIAKNLTERGAIVTEIIVYERKLPEINVKPYLDLLHDHSLDVVICTSVEGLQNLKTLLEPAWEFLQNIKLVVISERMRMQAKQLGFKYVGLAESPENEMILAALLKRNKA